MDPHGKSPSRADHALEELQAGLVQSFREVLPDPSHAESLAVLVVSIARFSFAGQTLHFRKVDYVMERNARIRAEREAGRTVSEIAEIVHLEPRHVRRLLKQAG